jgi:hypothetical protein
MIIPNKFNGYSADNRRIYNNPALVVATIANMGEGVAVAEALAAAAATATAAQTASTVAAEQAAAQAAAQQAGQAGIMSGSAVPPPGVTPPGVPGLGAPMPPAQPLPPAGGTPFTPPAPAGVDAMGVPDVTSGGINSVTPANQISTAPQPPGLTAGQQNFLNSSTAGPGTGSEFYTGGGAQPVGLQNSLNPVGVEASGGLGQAPAGFESLVRPVAEPVVKSSFLEGAQKAWDVVSNTAQSAYKTYREAPMPLQALTALGAGKAYQKFFGPESPGEEKYEDMDMSGFSPSEPIQQPFQRSYDWQGYAVGGPVEEMSAMNAVGANANYPQADLQTAMYSNPMIQRPQANNVINQGLDVNVDPYTGQERFAKGGIASGSTYDADKEAAEAAAQRKRYSQMMGDRSSDIEADIAQGQAIASKARGSGVGIVPFERTNKSPHAAAIDRYQHLAKKVKVPGIKMPKTNLGNISDYTDTMGSGPVEAARGGIMHGLGGYSDGGRLLKGPGDGVSDSIPAVIGNRQPARLADGEFVVPARIVSELGNGSTEAGARKLYAMMERIQKQRGKTVGKNKVAVNSKAAKHLPA